MTKLMVMANIEETNDILRAWKAWQRGQGLSENTVIVRERVIRYFLEVTGAGPLTITPTQVIEFVGRRGLSASSRSTYHRYLTAYSKWLAATDRRIDDPTEKTPRPRQPRGLPRPIGNTELPVVFNQCGRRKTKMMLYLAAYQGFRVHEIAKIRGEDVNISEGEILVLGKGDKLAILPLHADVAALAEQFPKKGYWFPSPSNKQQPVGPGSVSAAISRACNRAGFDRTAHQLRHWYATALLDSGVDIRYVQELMRHESLATTQIYTQVSKDKLREAIKGLRIQISPDPEKLVA